MSSPPTPVITEATLLKRQKNKEAAKASRNNKKQTTSAYEDYFNEMEQWHPLFQVKYNHLLDLLTKARARFDNNDPLGVEMDDAFITLLPRIPDTIVLEKTAKPCAGRPAEKACRRSRGYVANNLQEVPNFNAPPLMAQYGAQLGQFANPPPASNQQVQVPASVPQFPAALDIDMSNTVNNTTVQPSALILEFEGLESGNSSLPISPQPKEDSSLLRDTISNAAGLFMDDTSPPPPTNNTDFNLNKPGHNNDFLVTAAMNEMDWLTVDIGILADNVSLRQHPQLSLLPSASYNQIGNNNFVQQPQQSFFPSVSYDQIGNNNFVQQPQQSFFPSASDNQIGNNYVQLPQQLTPTYPSPLNNSSNNNIEPQIDLSLIIAWDDAQAQTQN